MQEQFALVQQHWERIQALTMKALKIIMVRLHNCMFRYTSTNVC